MESFGKLYVKCSHRERWHFLSRTLSCLQGLVTPVDTCQVKVVTCQPEESAEDGREVDLDLNTKGLSIPYDKVFILSLAWFGRACRETETAGHQTADPSF